MMCLCERHFDLYVSVRPGPQRGARRSGSGIVPSARPTIGLSQLLWRGQRGPGISAGHAIDASRDKARPCCRSHPLRHSEVQPESAGIRPSRSTMAVILGFRSAVDRRDEYMFTFFIQILQMNFASPFSFYAVEPRIIRQALMG